MAVMQDIQKTTNQEFAKIFQAPFPNDSMDGKGDEPIIRCDEVYTNVFQDKQQRKPLFVKWRYMQHK